MLRGFSRLFPPKGSADEDGETGEGNIVPLPGPEHGWLPAIEVMGEGVFLEFTSDRLRKWEERPDVIDRVDRLALNFDPETSQDPMMAATPRFTMLHTLSHALIDQWALESGYSAAALAERLYVADDQAGVLIYTATSDSAGQPREVSSR